MQGNLSRRSDRLDLSLILGGSFTSWAVIVSGWVGFILMAPIAIVLAWAMAIPIKVSLIMTAGGLAVVLSLAICLLLWVLARRNPDESRSIRLVAIWWTIGCVVGQATVWFLLSGAIGSPSP